MLQDSYLGGLLDGLFGIVIVLVCAFFIIAKIRRQSMTELMDDVIAFFKEGNKKGVKPIKQQIWQNRTMT